MSGLAFETGIDGAFTGVAGGDIPADSLVKKVGATWVVNGAGEVPDGVAATLAASGETVRILPVSGGLRKVIAAAAIAVGVAIYAAASGKVATTVSGDPIGKSNGVASAANGKISSILY